jgi:hypothetical protein
MYDRPFGWAPDCPYFFSDGFKIGGKLFQQPDQFDIALGFAL